MSSRSQPIRTLLLAAFLVAVALGVRHHFEAEPIGAPPEEDVRRPAVRVARDTSPTIVEPNENWLENNAAQPALDESAPLTGPELPDLPGQPAGVPNNPDILR